ncbi:hypothetical protein NW759_017381, partial [Fusarium solani]
SRALCFLLSSKKNEDGSFGPFIFWISWCPVAKPAPPPSRTKIALFNFLARKKSFGLAHGSRPQPSTNF